MKQVFQKKSLIGISKCWIHLLSDNFLRIQPSTIEGAGSGLFTRKRYNNTNGDESCSIALGGNVGSPSE